MHREGCFPMNAAGVGEGVCFSFSNKILSAQHFLISHWLVNQSLAKGIFWTLKSLWVFAYVSSVVNTCCWGDDIVFCFLYVDTMVEKYASYMLFSTKLWQSTEVPQSTWFINTIVHSNAFLGGKCQICNTMFTTDFYCFKYFKNRRYIFY